MKELYIKTMPNSVLVPSTAFALVKKLIVAYYFLFLICLFVYLTYSN